MGKPLLQAISGHEGRQNIENSEERTFLCEQSQRELSAKVAHVIYDSPTSWLVEGSVWKKKSCFTTKFFKKKTSELPTGGL